MEVTLEYNYYLPLEMLTHIFSFVDRRTLVHSCRLVCRFWKDAAECSVVWKGFVFRAIQECDSSVKSLLGRTYSVYPWYMCYAIARNLFYRNLLPNCCAEDNRIYWRYVLGGSEGLVANVPLDIHPEGYDELPSDLIDEGVNNCFLTSFGDCSINQTIDLYAYGFTRSILELRPPVHISEWFAVGFNFGAMCHVEVSFFDSRWVRDYENGQFHHASRLMNHKWHKVTYTFTNYRTDVRYIKFNHGIDTFLPVTNGRCREIVNYGNSAAKMAAAKLVISLPDLSEIFDCYETDDFYDQ